MTTTTTKLRHEPTDTQFEFGGHIISNDTTKVDEIHVQTPNVILTRRHFHDSEDGHAFDDEHIHPKFKGEVTAKIVAYDTTGPHCVVKGGDHVALYLPMDIVYAIADAANWYDVDSMNAAESVA